MAATKLRLTVVLAAGAGTRFWPYNVVRQKAAFPIANVPVIRRVMDDLAAIGMERIVVVVGAGEASVRAALRGCCENVVFVRQSGAPGTATAASLFVLMAQVYPLYFRLLGGANRYGAAFGLLTLFVAWFYVLAHVLLFGTYVNATHQRRRRRLARTQPWRNSGCGS